jgi:membrane-bound ClpP family serine protease
MIRLLSHPDAAYAALMLGMMLSFIEFLRPGLVVAGALGGTVLLLGFAHLFSIGFEPLGVVVWLGAWVVVLLAVRWPIPAIVPALLVAVAGRFLVGPPRVSWWVTGLFSIPCAWLAVYLLRLAMIALANKMRY